MNWNVVVTHVFWSILVGLIWFNIQTINPSKSDQTNSLFLSHLLTDSNVQYNEGLVFDELTWL